MTEIRRIHRRRRYGRQRCGEFTTDFAGKRAPTVDLSFAGIIPRRWTGRCHSQLPPSSRLNAHMTPARRRSRVGARLPAKTSAGVTGLRRIHRRIRDGRQRCGEFATDFAGKRAPTVDLRFAGIIRGGGRGAAFRICTTLTPECMHRQTSRRNARITPSRRRSIVGARLPAKTSAGVTGLRRIHRRRRYGRQRCGEFTTDFAGKRAYKGSAVCRYSVFRNPDANNVQWRADQRLLLDWRTFRLLIHNGHTRSSGRDAPRHGFDARRLSSLSC